MSIQLLTSLPLAIAPLPEVGFVLQAGAAGSALGTFVAALARRRDPGVDVARIGAAWTMLGLATGFVAATVSALGHAL